MKFIIPAIAAITTFTTITFSVTGSYFSPRLEIEPAQAQQVYGAIGDKWNSMGRGKGALGYPLTDELDAVRGGRFNRFEYGYIYWHPKIGARAVYGDIAKKWNSMGRERGALGYPLSDELGAAGGGRFNEFEYGYIYWHPNTGAHAVYGDIAKKWNSMGRERGRLGYPTSDELDSGSGGNRVSYFSNGYIYWNSANRAISVVYK